MSAARPRLLVMLLAIFTVTGCQLGGQIAAQAVADQIDWANIDATGVPRDDATDRQNEILREIGAVHASIGIPVWVSTTAVANDSILEGVNSRNGCDTRPVGDTYRFNSASQSQLESWFRDTFGYILNQALPYQLSDPNSRINYSICFDHTSLRTAGDECEVHSFNYRYFILKEQSNASQAGRTGPTCSLSDYDPTQHGSQLIYASPLLNAEGSFSEIVIQDNPDGVINTNEVEYYAQAAAYYQVIVDILSDGMALNALSDFEVIRDAQVNNNRRELKDSYAECEEIGFPVESEEFRSCVETLSD